MMQKKRTSNKKNNNLYVPTVITRSIILTFEQAGGNVKQFMEKKIAHDIEGKCIIEGFVEPDSIKIISYSSGKLQGNNVVFEVVIECNICSPVEGMHVPCIAKNITQAGIRAEVEKQPSPVIIYVSRDHHYSMDYFNGNFYFGSTDFLSTDEVIETDIFGNLLSTYSVGIIPGAFTFWIND